MAPPPWSSAPSRLLPNLSLNSKQTVAAAAAASSSPAGGQGRRPLRYAVLGAGFAGLSVAWYLLKHSPRDSRVSVDIYDENGVGGGASGVSGGLLHPYSPKVYMPLALNINPKKYLQVIMIRSSSALGPKLRRIWQSKPFDIV
nr:unnamed protein product [Digitaria exilis]